MGGLIDGPKEVKAPPVRVAPPTPTIDADAVGADAKKKRPRGTRDTFLTGNLAPSESFLAGKKKGLG
jgi:hypothetical protein